MANVVKMCDMQVEIAAKVFEMLNPGKVKVDNGSWCSDRANIKTDVEPSELIYPEGWYYAKGNFRNKHTSTTGMYQEIRMIKSNGESWKNSAPYCTLD